MALERVAWLQLGAALVGANFHHILWALHIPSAYMHVPRFTHLASWCRHVGLGSGFNPSPKPYTVHSRASCATLCCILCLHSCAGSYANPNPPTADQRMRPLACIYMQVDIYALGLLLWQLWTGDLVPWPNDPAQLKDTFRVMGYPKVMVRPEEPDDMPTEYAIIMHACWAATPAKRPTAKKVAADLRKLLEPLSPITACSG